MSVIDQDVCFLPCFPVRSGGDGSAVWSSPPLLPVPADGRLPPARLSLPSALPPSPPFLLPTLAHFPPLPPPSLPGCPPIPLSCFPLVKFCSILALLWRAGAALWTPRARWPCWWASSLPLFSTSPSGASEAWCPSWCTPRSRSLITLDLTMSTPTSVIWECRLPRLATPAPDPPPRGHRWETARSPPRCWVCAVLRNATYMALC